MIRSAASLIGSTGVSATSFSHILEDSGAPRGSIYHHFPSGKEQLAAAAMDWTTDRILEHQNTCKAATPWGVVEHFIDLFREVVRASNGASGCAVAGVAVDTAAEADLMRVVQVTFRSWTDLLTRQLKQAGLEHELARTSAVATVASVEGALILCRAEGGGGPLDDVASQIRRSLG